VREGHGCRFVVHDFQRQIIGIEAINKVIDAFSSSISMGDNYDLMSSFNEALRDKCGFPHLPYLGRKRHHAYIMDIDSTGGKTFRANWGECS
jgi:hypothetical protein